MYVEGHKFKSDFLSNHREFPDNFTFVESLIISPKIPFDELFLKNIL